MQLCAPIHIGQVRIQRVGQILDAGFRQVLRQLDGGFRAGDGTGLGKHAQAAVGDGIIQLGKHLVEERQLARPDRITGFFEDDLWHRDGWPDDLGITAGGVFVHAAVNRFEVGVFLRVA